jgi:hypothetical protein
VAQGRIEPSQSEWASNVVIVKKKDGSLRFCVDYRQLNEGTIKDSYPWALPRIDDCLDCLGGATWYSTMDLRSGYHQVVLDDTNIKPPLSLDGVPMPLISCHLDFAMLRQHFSDLWIAT